MKTNIMVCLTLVLLSNCSSLMAQEDEWFQKGLNATNPDEKIEYFTKSIQQNPRWQPFAGRGNVKFALADYQGALEDFQEALKYFGTIDMQVKFQLANYESLNERQQGIFDDLLSNDLLKEDLEEWLKKVCARDLFFIYYNLGITNRFLQNFLDAHKYFTQALEIMPEETAMHWGTFKYSNKYYELSMEESNESTALDSAYINAYFNRGLTYLDLQQYTKAFTDFEKTLELDPKNAGAYFYHGKAFYFLGQRHKTIADLSEYLLLVPDSPDVYNLRGKIYLTLSKYDSALADFNKTISLKPDYSIAFGNIGYVYLQQNKPDLAIENFNECLSYDNKSVSANMNLAIIYYMQGDKAKAKNHLYAAKVLEPRLMEGMGGITKLIEEGYYWTERDKETLAKMFAELK